MKIRRPNFGSVWRLLVAMVMVCLARPAMAQTPATVLEGIVTTQAGSVKLPGAEVVVRDSSNQQVTSLLCGEDSHFRIENLKPGVYRLVASLPGFVATTIRATINAGQTVNLAIDLPIEGISQSVDVVGTGAIVPSAGTFAPTETLSGQDIDRFAGGGGIQGSLRLLASIVEVPGGFSIKGGRPNQAGMQLGSSTLADSGTGISAMSLPDDAIDSISVMPDPYAVEYGRFSSGLVVVQTKRASNQWKIRLNNLGPAFRTTRDSPINVYGIGYWAPRLEVGGPVIKDKLFVLQTAQFRYSASEVSSLPPDELRVAHAFSSFTRADANVAPNQTIVATAGFFPGVSHQATLGTFVPPQATVDIHSQASETGVTHRLIWNDNLFSETTVHAHGYTSDVYPQGLAPMQLLPDTVVGNFYNDQHRNTSTEQVIETLSGSHTGAGGMHLFKLGLDLLHNGYDGESDSRPVLIERADGSLARRLDWSGTTFQSLETTDVALFAQDRFQPNASWYLEYGARIDRDGVNGNVNVTPRIGTALLLTPSGNAVLRGGVGLFYERTPSTAGVFDQFEDATDTRYAADGVTPLGPPLTFVRTTGTLETPRSRTWDIAYEQRVNSHWSFHIAALDRQGSHELIVNPVVTGTTAQLQLTSTGNSSYRGAEVNVHFSLNTKADLGATYARSSSHGDLNTLTNYLDLVMNPVVGQNAYAPSSADVPNRLMMRGTYMPSERWLLIGIFDWRTGLPYSVVDEMLDYVGPRNSLRFPDFVRTEVGVERRFQVGKLRPWFGVRVWNALNAWLPTDVQNNLASPAYGTFYNSEYRQFRIQLRFER
jgi:Carboxypeptidase regulatory-like domain/TonB dependent receptor